MEHWRKVEYGWVGGWIDNRVQTGVLNRHQGIFNVRMKLASSPTRSGVETRRIEYKRNLIRDPWREMTLSFHWMGYIEVSRRFNRQKYNQAGSLPRADWGNQMDGPRSVWSPFWDFKI